MTDENRARDVSFVTVWVISSHFLGLLWMMMVQLQAYKIVNSGPPIGSGTVSTTFLVWIYFSICLRVYNRTFTDCSTRCWVRARQGIRPPGCTKR